MILEKRILFKENDSLKNVLRKEQNFNLKNKIQTKNFKFFEITLVKNVLNLMDLVVLSLKFSYK